MRRVILRLPADVESEITSWRNGKPPEGMSPLLVRVLFMALVEPIEWLGDDLDLENPAPRQVRIGKVLYVEQK